MKKQLSKVLALTLTAGLALSGCADSKKTETTAAPAGSAAPETPAVESQAGNSTYNNDGTIKIGGAYQLSGTNVFQGDIVKEGAMLAMKEINEKGGVLGRQLELVEEDAGETTQDTVTATTKLLERGDITAILGCLSSSYNIAVSEVIKEYQVPLFAMGSSANVWKENNDFMWQIRVTDNYSAKVMTKAAVENLGMKKPGLFYCTNSFGQGIADGVKTSLKEDYNIDPAGEVTFAVGETNYSALLTQLLASGCDGIIAVSDGDESSLIMKQVYSMRVDLPCIGSAAYGTIMNMENAGLDAAAGWYTVSDWSAELEMARSQAFIESWNMEYPDKPPLQQNLYSYDAVYLLAEAIEQAGSADPAAVKEALKGVKNYEGAMSVYTPDTNRSFATTQLLCINKEDGSVGIVESLKFR